LKWEKPFGTEKTSHAATPISQQRTIRASSSISWAFFVYFPSDILTIMSIRLTMEKIWKEASIGRGLEACHRARARYAKAERSKMLLSEAEIPARGAREKQNASLGGGNPGPGCAREAKCFSRRRKSRPGVRERSKMLLSEAEIPARGAREKQNASLGGGNPGPGCAREAKCFSRRRKPRLGVRERSKMLLSEAEPPVQKSRRER
jgi:hypothetical protein